MSVRIYLQSLHACLLTIRLSGAGIIIVTESGGRVVSSQPPEGWVEGMPIPPADLGGRLYLAIRGCAGTPDESAIEAQDRVIKEVWKRAEPLDYVRPMI